MLYLIAYSGIIAVVTLVFILYWPLLITEHLKKNEFIVFTMSVGDILKGPIMVFIVLMMIGVYHHRYLLYYSPLPDDFSYFYQFGKNIKQ